MTNPRSYLAFEDRTNDVVPSSPHLRVSMNRNNPIYLDGTWQTIPFVNGATPARDMNSFPSGGARFDYTNTLFWPNTAMANEQCYELSLDMAVANSLQNTSVKLAVRMIVPSPMPVYFPLPDSLQRIDLPDQVVAPGGGVHFGYPIYTSAGMKQYGMQIQVRGQAYQSGLVLGLLANTVTTLVGTSRPQLTDAVLNVYAAA